MEFVYQNILLISIVVISGLGLIWPALVRRAGTAVNPGAATLLINRENAVVLDVREAEEFAQGHLPDAINLPAGKLVERLAEIEKYKDKPLIVCCAAGMRSNRACRDLGKQGFNQLYNLEGGVDAWVGAGYPIKKGSRNK
ncbi:rhodanese-like domain-containing protein [Dechloromonas sp. ZY10]|uniref:rhodanese-like domain-containing protein n=1 Tax=Dechloromonas aquae TaxID=2664436 RepID=UPI003526DA0C